MSAQCVVWYERNTTATLASLPLIAAHSCVLCVFDLFWMCLNVQISTSDPPSRGMLWPACHVLLTVAHSFVLCVYLNMQISTLDPPSKGMLWQRLTGISIDLGLGEVSRIYTSNITFVPSCVILEKVIGDVATALVLCGILISYTQVVVRLGVVPDTLIKKPASSISQALPYFNSLNLKTFTKTAIISQAVVRLGVVPDPLMTAGLISISGSIIRARQQGFTPVMFDKIFRVGAYHAASIPTPVKGARCVFCVCVCVCV